MEHSSRTLLALFTALTFLAASCAGGSTESTGTVAEETPAATEQESEVVAASNDAGIRLVSTTDGLAIVENPPEDLVILDVRTPEEFSTGYIDGATMIDFYESDFAQQIATLDPDVPYLIYCNSGNRSGQTATLMNELGFHDVADVDGGITAWNALGLPTVNP